jgi:hypothetical protein
LSFLAGAAAAEGGMGAPTGSWFTGNAAVVDINSFAIKSPDRVILHKTKPNQMRLHRAVFVGFHVLAVRTRACGRRPLWSLTVSFHSSNELPYFSEVPWITHSIDLVHPFGPIHEACANKEENHKKLMIYIQNRG